MNYEVAGISCPKCGGSMFPASLYRGGYIIGGVKCVNCGEIKHKLTFGGYENYPHKPKGGSIVGKKKNDKKGKGKRITKVFGLLLVLMLFAMPVMAADLFNTPFGLDNLKGLNLQADTLYLPSSGSFAVGAGMTLATIYNDTIEVRGEIVSPISDEPTKAGLGIGVNIPKLLSQFGGTWLMSGVNASIGVTGLINLNGNAHVEPAVYVTLFQVGL